MKNRVARTAGSMGWAWLITLLFGCLVPAVSSAQVRDASAAEQAVARDHFQKGQDRFLAGEYLQAVEHFKIAYDLTGSPEILYNIGRCYEQQGALQEARDYYELYLQEAENPSDRDEVEQRISWLNEQIGDDGAGRVVESNDDGEIDPDGDEAGDKEETKWDDPKPKRKLEAFELSLRLGPAFVVMMPKSQENLERHHYFAVDFIGDFFLNDWFAIGAIIAFAGYIPGSLPIKGREAKSQAGVGLGVTGRKSFGKRTALTTRLLAIPTAVHRANSPKDAFWMIFQGSVGLFIGLPKSFGVLLEGVVDAGPAVVINPDPMMEWSPSMVLSVGARLGVSYRF